MVCEGVAGVAVIEPPHFRSPEYNRYHKAVRSTRGPARAHACIQCGDPALEWAWQRGTDPAVTASYEPMCHPCHVLYDYTDEVRAKIAERMRGTAYAAGTTYNRGSRNGMSKLTADDVRAIRERYESGGVTYADLGEVYGIHRFSVGQIIRRERWKHV